MRIYKIIFILALVGALTLSGCSIHMPSKQPNTKWISDDSKIEFSVDDTNIPIGVLHNGDENIEICLAMSRGMGNTIEVYLADDLEDGAFEEGKRLETWTAKFKKASKFEVTVVESTYYTVGDTIVFFRIDE